MFFKNSIYRVLKRNFFIVRQFCILHFSQFLPSYDELIQACEFFEREEYGEAINNAEKSYESILKVICHLQRGNADKLTKDYITNRSNNLPVSMIGEGFREKVLMSLPYIRNNSASDHGAGATPVSISKPLAKLAVNMAAALNTYLIEEYTASIHFMENDCPKEDGGYGDSVLTIDLRGKEDLTDCAAQSRNGNQNPKELNGITAQRLGR